MKKQNKDLQNENRKNGEKILELEKNFEEKLAVIGAAEENSRLKLEEFEKSFGKIVDELKKVNFFL